MSTAVDQSERAGEKQRLFTVTQYQARKWNHFRNVIIKMECHAGGTNRRAVVTNRPGAMIVPQGVYDDYIQRGESENRNKELKIDLCGGRLSDHRFMANLFRLCLHTLVLNLLIRLRSQLPRPEAAEPGRSVPGLDRESPTVPEGRELHRAQPATWRLRIITAVCRLL